MSILLSPELARQSLLSAVLVPSMAWSPGKKQDCLRSLGHRKSQAGVRLYSKATRTVFNSPRTILASVQPRRKMIRVSVASMEQIAQIRTPTSLIALHFEQSALGQTLRSPQAQIACGARLECGIPGRFVGESVGCLAASPRSSLHGWTRWARI